MKTLIFVIIFFMMYLIIEHFFMTNKEGLANCNTAQHDLTYKNTATIRQQQTEIDDFKSNMESQLNSLQSRVKGFNAQISKNTKGIASNATNIKSTVKDVNDAKKQKAKEYGKDWDRLEKGIKSGSDVPPPIAMKDKNGDDYLLAGNTRMMSFTASGKKLPIKVIDYDKEFQYDTNDQG